MRLWLVVLFVWNGAGQSNGFEMRAYEKRAACIEAELKYREKYGSDFSACGPITEKTWDYLVTHAVDAEWVKERKEGNHESNGYANATAAHLENVR